VIILIDLGSTHNFVDARLAETLVKKMLCQLQKLVYHNLCGINTINK
jgi:hypothetical protein